MFWLCFSSNLLCFASSFLETLHLPPHFHHHWPFQQNPTNIYPKTCQYYLLNLEPIAMLVYTTSVPGVQSCGTLQYISLVNSGLRVILLDVSCFAMKPKWIEAVLEQSRNCGHNFQQDVRCFGEIFLYRMEALVNYCVFSPKTQF